MTAAELTTSAIPNAVPRLIVGGTHRGVGKSTLALALAMELRRRKVATTLCVRSFSPRALVLQRYSGRTVHILDRDILTIEQISALLLLASRSSDLILIDGEGGVYDGSSSLSLTGSDAELATLTDTPLLLVVDGSEPDLRQPPLVAGHYYLATGFKVIGTFFNRVFQSTMVEEDEIEMSRNHGADPLFHAAAAQVFDQPQPLGYMRALRHAPLKEMNGSIPESTTQTIDLAALSELESALIGDNLSDHIIAGAGAAPPLDQSLALPTIQHDSVPIAITFDTCFGLGVADNHTLIRHFGGMVKYISPLVDSGLPSGIGGIYITGCYLEEYHEELLSNQRFVDSLRDFVTRGGVVYAEGSGAAYLGKRWVIGNISGDGVGVIRDTVKIPRNEDGSQVTLTPATFRTEDLSVIGDQGREVKGYWRSIPLPYSERAVLAPFTVSTNIGIPELDGFAPYPNLLATTGYLHWGSNPDVARFFVDACRTSIVRSD